MEITSAMVEALVARLFAPELRADAAETLARYGTESSEREALRVRVAVLKLSQGSLSRLRELVAGAKQDYRDVLAWAEYPEELRTPTWRLSPAEQARIREADRAQYLAWLETHRE